jgi:hypothetical protein
MTLIRSYFIQALEAQMNYERFYVIINVFLTGIFLDGINLEIMSGAR